MANKQQTVFDVRLEENAVVGTPGILDQFNLPPALITFLQKNQRTLWKVVGCIAAVVVAGALHGSYRDYKLNKAAEAYDQAMLLENAKQKAAALEKIVEDHGATPSATWSRIALAHLDQAAGKNKEAIVKLSGLEAELDNDNAIKPLILANVGSLYEQEKQFEQADKIYQTLKGIKGFEAMALSSLGRIYEAMGRKEQAVQMYQQYMGLAELGQDKQGSSNRTAARQDFPERDLVQASLNRLLQ